MSVYSTPYNYICLTLFYSVVSDGKVALNYGDSYNLVSTRGFSKTKLLRFKHTRNTSNTAHANSLSQQSVFTQATHLTQPAHSVNATYHIIQSTVFPWAVLDVLLV